MRPLEQPDLFNPSDTSRDRLPELTRQAAQAELRQLLLEATTMPKEKDDWGAGNHGG
jgi:hypothetical protein